MKIKSATTRAALIIAIAIAIVAGVSFLPLEKWSGGTLKDFNILSDILNLPGDSADVDSTGLEGLDPELAKLMQEAQAAGITLNTEAQSDSAGLSSTELQSEGSLVYIDRDTVIQPVKLNKVNGVVGIEDYTTGNVGLIRLKTAIRSGRLGRLAFVGDSYIEGDIITQNLRELLQDAYGGEGVGYVNMYSEFPGFRRSVKQSGSGWESFSAMKNQGNPSYLGLAEQYFLPTGTATSTYEGVTSLKHLNQWSRSRFLFISPNNTVVSVKTQNNGWIDHTVTGSTGVQCIQLNEPTNEFSIRVTDRKLVGLGVWLDGTKGISLDCMSSRGYSGVTLSKISASLCRAMGRDISYDLIILEFGMNAMSPSQTNYSIYSDQMVKVINHVRACYPNADVLLLGIGDRGQKKGGNVQSMSVIPNMISAQRDAARKAHCLFWDTREAMGGDGAILKWFARQHVNKDYIHMNHEGGAELAKLLFRALQDQLK